MGMNSHPHNLLNRLYSFLCVYLRKGSRRSCRAAVMSKISRAFLAALQSLARTTSRMRGLLVSWYIRFLHERHGQSDLEWKAHGSFAQEVERLLGQFSDPVVLEAFSLGLQKQFRHALRLDPKCMLPSYNHLLPDGKERGTFLALDVGGSTFRVALVEALGPDNELGELRILSLRSYRITKVIKQLKGMEFFEWMAARIEETILEQNFVIDEVHGISVGLAWSFPIEQTSLRSGLIQGMGKGFLASDTLSGKDLGDVIEKACEVRNLNVHVNAIVNDSTGTLLSRAYTDPFTRYGLILGTGVNIAVHLPVGMLERPKFGVRPDSWHDAAKDVIVNTELGMFGKGVLPLTRWDVQLNAAHERPDFQPLEHLVGGRYLGEVARLVLVDGIVNANVLGGHIPANLEEPYSLDTETLAKMQSSKSIQEARAIFLAQHPTPKVPSDADVNLLRLIAYHVSKRAAAIIAASLHALWVLRNEGVDGKMLAKEHTVIACNGSVVEHYPDFTKNCQSFLDTLIVRSGGRPDSMGLVIAKESSILGAAVAVAAIEEKK